MICTQCHGQMICTQCGPTDDKGVKPWLWSDEAEVMHSLLRRDRRLFDQYVVITQRRRMRGFRGEPLPPFHAGGRWWSKFERTARIVLGQFGSLPAEYLKRIERFAEAIPEELDA